MADILKDKLPFLSGKVGLQGLLLAAGVSVSLGAAFLVDPSDTRELFALVLLPAAGVLALAAPSSRRIWIPVLIGSMIIRDFSLGSLFGGAATLKIGDIFIAYLFILWLLGHVFIKDSVKFVKSGLDLCIVLFILFHVCSLLWSTDLEYGLLRCMKLVRNFLFYLIMRELFIRDFTAGYRSLTVSYVVTGLLLLLVHFSVVFSAGGLSDLLSLVHTKKAALTSIDLGALRVRGTGGGFFITGPSMWLMITGTVVFGSIMMTNSRLGRWLKVLLALTMFAGATLVLSRSTFVMLAGLMALLFLGSVYLRSKSNIIAISTILFLFAAAGAAAGLDDIYQKRFTNAFQDGSWTQRVDLYLPAIDAFLEHPLAGIGAGSNYSWQAHYPEIGKNQTRIVHSTYLLVLSETGVVGSIFFLAMLYFWIRYLWDCVRNRGCEPRIRSACMALLAFSVSYLVYMSVVGEFEEFEPWLVMAIASAVRNLKGSIDSGVLLPCAAPSGERRGIERI